MPDSTPAVYEFPDTKRQAVTYYPFAILPYGSKNGKGLEGTTFMDENAFYIYALANPLFPSIPYVGLTNDLQRRYAEHCKGPQVWIHELLELGTQPLLLTLESHLRGREIASRYERYWIEEMHQDFNVLQNTQHNTQSSNYKAQIASDRAAELVQIAQMPLEDRARLLALHTEGIFRYRDHYCAVYFMLSMQARHAFAIDTSQHRIQLAEIALAFCGIPRIEDIQRYETRYKHYRIQGLDKEAAAWEAVSDRELGNL